LRLPRKALMASFAAGSPSIRLNVELSSSIRCSTSRGRLRTQPEVHENAAFDAHPDFLAHGHSNYITAVW